MKGIVSVVLMLSDMNLIRVKPRNSFLLCIMYDIVGVEPYRQKVGDLQIDR